MVRTGPSGDIRDAPDTGGGSDDEDDSGTTGGGSIPGAPDDGGGSDPPSDDPGIDPTDPSDAPSASPPDQGTDPDDPRDAPSASPPDPTPPEGGSDDATGGGQTDTTGSDRGASGDIDFRFADQSDAIDSDPEFRSDSRARAAAEELLARGRDVGDRVGGGAADVIDADPAERDVLQSFASAGTTIPGSAAVLGADAADAAGFITEPARDAVEPGAMLGGGDIATIGAETATRTGEIGAAAGDEVIEGTDRVLDIDFERRAEGEGAAISFTDDPQVRQQLAGSLAFGAASLGVAGPASSATRGAVGAVSRGTPDADAGGSGPAVTTGRSNVGTGGVDQILDADTVDARRGTSGPSTRSRLRGEASRTADDLTERVGDAVDPFVPSAGETGSLRAGLVPESATERRTPDAPRDFDGDDRVSDNLVQQSLNRQQRAERGAVDRGDFEPAPDPFGPGTRRGTITEGGDVELTRSTGAVETRADTATGGATSRFASTGAGAGAAGVGSLADVNDPTGISETAAPTGRATLEPARILGAGTDATGAETLSERNDATNIAPPASETDADSETDTFAPTDTGTGTDQPPVSDTDQPPVTDTPAPPMTDTPPVTDTPAPPVTGTPAATDTPVPQTPRPPTRTPLVPAVRPPVPRRPRRPPERNEEPDPLILGDDDDDDEPAPRPAAEAPLLPGFGAETFTAFATGAFGARELASGADEPSLVGELPTETLADPSDDEAGALAAVSEQFFGEFGGEA